MVAVKKVLMFMKSLIVVRALILKIEVPIWKSYDLVERSPLPVDVRGTHLTQLSTMYGTLWNIYFHNHLIVTDRYSL